MNPTPSFDGKTVLDDFDYVIGRGESFIADVRLCRELTAGLMESGIWSYLWNYGGLEQGGLVGDAGLGASLGNLEGTLQFWKDLEAASDYLGAGMVIARANAGMLEPDLAVELIRRMHWCKAKDIPGMRKNLVHRLKRSGHFEEIEGGCLVLRDLSSGDRPVKGEGEALDVGPACSAGDLLREVELNGVNGTAPAHSAEG